VRRTVALVLLALVGLGDVARAHEIRPAFLELTQDEAEGGAPAGAATWRVLWKVPLPGEPGVTLVPDLPAGCSAAAEPVTGELDDALVTRWPVRCPGGLGGGTIRVAGLARATTDVLVRIAPVEGPGTVLRLTPASPSILVPATPDRLDRAATYLRLGIEHILTGVDHLLFLLGLLLLVRGVGPLIGTITAFTVAHSLSLALATFGVIALRPALVEALIALSIVLVAVELVRQQRGEAGLTTRHPWLVAFGFGLLHGLGFAAALGQLGLPRSEIPLALFLFNVGVELGQLAFVLVCLLAARAALQLGRMPRWAPLVPAYTIGSLAAAWWLARVGSMIG